MRFWGKLSQTMPKITCSLTKFCVIPSCISYLWNLFRNICLYMYNSYEMCHACSLRSLILWGISFFSFFKTYEVTTIGKKTWLHLSRRSCSWSNTSGFWHQKECFRVSSNEVIWRLEEHTRQAYFKYFVHYVPVHVLGHADLWHSLGKLTLNRIGWEFSRKIMIWQTGHVPRITWLFDMNICF